MTFARSLMAISLLGTALTASPVAADLTAADVWGDWRSQFETLGYSVDASPRASATGLLVDEITVRSKNAPETSLVFGPLEFSSMAEGRVAIRMPDALAFRIERAGTATAHSLQLAFTYTQTGHSLIVRSTPTGLSYDYSADSYQLSLTHMAVGGETSDPSKLRFSASGDRITSQTETTAGDPGRYDHQIELGTVTTDLFFQDDNPAVSLTANTVLDSTALSLRGRALRQGIADASQMPAPAPSVEGTLRTQKTETRLTLVSEEGTTKIKTATGASMGSIATHEDGRRLTGDTSDIQIGAQLAGLPIPLFAQVAQTGFDLRTPQLAPDTPAAPFSLAAEVTDITLSDVIWALFDADAQLPRDPASATVRLNGTATPSDQQLPPLQSNPRGGVGGRAGQIETLSVERLDLDALGARLGASGDLSFDHNDLTTFPGTPKPTGTLKFEIEGANTLLDKLVTMKMIPALHALGLRISMSLFAQEGDAPDTMTSTLEFQENGGILVNGKQFK